MVALTELTPVTLTAEAIGLALVLQILTEDRMAAGLDMDGSNTIGRALQILGGWDRIAETVTAPGAPWDSAAGEQRSVVRRMLRLVEPILARTAKPSAKVGI